MTGGILTCSQAYQAVQEYLAEFLRQLTDANLGDVLSDMNPHIWAESQFADPAVPGDWSNAAAAVAAGSAAPSLGDGGPEPALPEQMWLAALFPFFDSMWPILGNLPLARLIELLVQPQVTLEGSGSSPWQLWLSATEGIGDRIE